MTRDAIPRGFGHRFDAKVRAGRKTPFIKYIRGYVR